MQFIQNYSHLAFGLSVHSSNIIIVMLVYTEFLILGSVPGVRNTLRNYLSQAAHNSRSRGGGARQFNRGCRRRRAGIARRPYSPAYAYVYDLLGMLMKYAPQLIQIQANCLYNFQQVGLTTLQIRATKRVLSAV